MVRAAVEYCGPVPPAIFRFKYAGRKSLGAPFANLLQFALDHNPELFPCSVLVPVPLHRQNERLRGFNQAAELALGLATLAQLPILQHILIRQKRTKPQFRLSKADRAVNAQGAFSVIDKAAVKGQRLLLIDDICTTGATLGECARVLRRAGAASVRALVLARDL